MTPVLLVTRGIPTLDRASAFVHVARWWSEEGHISVNSGDRDSGAGLVDSSQDSRHFDTMCWRCFVLPTVLSAQVIQSPPLWITITLTTR